MAGRFQAPKGTRDLLPPDTALWAAVEATARRVFALYGFGEIRTPLFEDTQLFARGVGESTDIVGKEMYSFVDKNERSLTLRPENTAPVVRAYVEHGMHRLPQPVKLFYIGPQFRYERPQKGRYRQFHQIGAEFLGGRGAESDSEVLLMLVAFLKELGFRDLRVLLNTVGDNESRASYRQALVQFLDSHRERLSEESVRRLVTNPLRILDSKSPVEQELLASAPQLKDSLTDRSVAHFASVCAALEQFGVAYEVAPRLVRGLDYYTNTVFEIVSEGLGAQNAICGGGAYEKLVEELGGPPTYGVGFAIGEDRLIEVLPENSKARGAAAHRARGPVVIAAAGRLPVKEGEPSPLFSLVERLRRRGLPAVEATGKQEKVFERANSMKSPCVVFIGEEELKSGTYSLRTLKDGSRQNLDEAGLVRELMGLYPSASNLQRGDEASEPPADAVEDDE
jgi:histidyl-tRNA synthetase